MEHQTTADIFLPQGRAINNNNNNNKHNKDEISTDIDITGYANGNQEHIDSVTPWQAKPTEATSPSQEAKRGNVSGAPQTAISYMKVDIFNNATDEELIEDIYKLHAKLSIKKHNTPTWQHASASLNSEKRMAKRGLRMDNTEHRLHWETVQQTYTSFKEEYKDVRVSKFYQSGSQKGKSIKGLSIVFSHQAEIAVVIIGQDEYPIALTNKGLTQTQRKKHIILSGTWSDDLVVRPDELNVNDWLKGV